MKDVNTHENADQENPRSLKINKNPRKNLNEKRTLRKSKIIIKKGNFQYVSYKKHYNLYDFHTLHVPKG